LYDAGSRAIRAGSGPVGAIESAVLDVFAQVELSWRSAVRYLCFSARQASGTALPFQTPAFFTGLIPQSGMLLPSAISAMQKTPSFFRFYTGFPRAPFPYILRPCVPQQINIRLSIFDSQQIPWNHIDPKQTT
jgi:hypothetical protein